MAAVFAWHLYTATRNGQLAINFKGVGLGDSWISPIDFVDTWPDYLYYLVSKVSLGLYDSYDRRVHLRFSLGSHRKD